MNFKIFDPLAGELAHKRKCELQKEKLAIERLKWEALEDIHIFIIRLTTLALILFSVVIAGNVIKASVESISKRVNRIELYELVEKDHKQIAILSDSLKSVKEQITELNTADSKIIGLIERQTSQIATLLEIQKKNWSNGDTSRQLKESTVQVPVKPKAKVTFVEVLTWILIGICGLVVIIILAVVLM